MRLVAISALALLACSSEAPRHEPVDEIGTTGQALRPDDPRSTDLYHYESNDVVLTYDTPGGHFRIRYTKAGKNAVPAADSNGDGVPNFVEMAADSYEASWTKYHQELGFREPLRAAGEPRFSVYILDFGGNGDGAFREEACLDTNPNQCHGFMVQENDYAGYGYFSIREANRILASHEYFHAIQAAYHAHFGSVVSEGTAVWATEAFDGDLDDFEGFLPGFLNNASRSIDEPLPGPVDPFSYGTGLFFRFLSEKYGETTIRELWEQCGSGEDADWVASLVKVLATKHATTFADMYTEFAEWNLRLGAWADPAKSYQDGAGYSELKIESGTLPWKEEKLRVFHASTRYTSFAPGPRRKITAALVPADGATLDGLVLSVALRIAPAETRVTRISDMKTGLPAIDVAGAKAVIVSVVNTTSSGNSIRPSLCVGSPEEVASCVKALSPVTEEPKPDPTFVPDPQAKTQDEGGCHQAPVGLIALAGFVTRRRRALVAG